MHLGEPVGVGPAPPPHPLFSPCPPNLWLQCAQTLRGTSKLICIQYLPYDT